MSGGSDFRFVKLRDCLVNFAQSFNIRRASAFRCSDFDWISTFGKGQQSFKIRENIIHFNQEKNMLGLKQLFVHSKSAIQSAIIPGNENVISIAKNFKFDVKAILSPAVPRTGTTSFLFAQF
jgi:8-amino-7-oxononanoate synthase